MSQEMSQVEIDFVYFDLGNILVSFDPAVACKNVASRFGVSESEAQSAVYDSGLQDRYEHGHVTGEQYADTLRKSLGLTTEQMPTQECLDAISDMFTPIESMSQIVTQTIAAGKRVGILSNTCHAHWDWIARQKWSATGGPFEIVILSCEVGAMKPAPQIYEAAEKAAGIPPERLLFIDDKHENVQAAIARGWNSQQCFGGDEAKKVFQKFGVLS